MRARETARALFDAAVAAADPAVAFRRSLKIHPLPQPARETLLLAIGKGAPAMLREALKHVRGAHRALAACHHDNTEDVPNVTVLRGAHPVPDAAGLAAAEKVLSFAGSGTAADHLVVLVSGGASAILPAPLDGISLEDKMVLHKTLLGAGLDITQMNLVRQQASRIKGGGLLRAAGATPVTGYILSDVVGDDLRVVSSGPTVTPIGTRDAAVDVLKSAGIWDMQSDAMRAALSQPSVAVTLPKAENHLIGSNGQSVAAMANVAPSDWTVAQANAPLEGDVQDAADEVVAIAKSSNPNTLHVMGGETTVRLQGAGLGGRNQELALRVAAGLEGSHANHVFLSGGTDGRDGPTDAAGGLVDPGTLARVRAAGHDLRALLANNDSNTALRTAGDLLITGATGTNVADVQALFILPEG